MLEPATFYILWANLANLKVDQLLLHHLHLLLEPVHQPGEVHEPLDGDDDEDGVPEAGQHLVRVRRPEEPREDEVGLHDGLDEADGDQDEDVVAEDPAHLPVGAPDRVDPPAELAHGDPPLGHLVQPGGQDGGQPLQDPAHHQVRHQQHRVHVPHQQEVYDDPGGERKA